jgi:hypothetical protein
VQTHEIRKRFLDHFVNAGHTEVPSASVILDDPNLLFVNAGMVQFVPFFLGQRTPPWDRATSVQKCIRTPDIDEVGITTRHNTFFQMAGNFSFGDYFKKGAIELAWSLLTNPVDQGGYGFDPERLWATVYLDDDEAADQQAELAGFGAHRDEHVESPPQAEDRAAVGLDRGPQVDRIAVGRVLAEREPGVTLGARVITAREIDQAGGDVSIGVRWRATQRLLGVTGGGLVVARCELDPRELDQCPGVAGRQLEGSLE